MGQRIRIVVFDGNAQDYYVGLDDTNDNLVVGLGSAVGTTPINIHQLRQRCHYLRWRN